MTLLRPELPTTHRRQGRLTTSQAAAHERLWPAYGVEGSAPLDPAALFGRRAPVVLEIGSGMGEATAALALAEPERDVLACELHRPGRGALLRRIGELGLTNVRVLDSDGRLVLRDLLGAAGLDVVRVFFPDPWPKSKHRKRRLVDDAFAALVADRLRPGGRLHVATDWAPYADQVRRALAGCRLLEPVQAPPRPVTRFEQQGRDAGRPAHDLAARRASV